MITAVFSILVLIMSIIVGGLMVGLIANGVSFGYSNDGQHSLVSEL